MNSLASRFGEDPKILTNADQLAPIRPMRSLLTGSKFGRVNPFFDPEPPFINMDEAIAELDENGIQAVQDQEGEGRITDALKLAAGVLPGAAGTLAKGALSVAGKAATAAAIGKTIGKLAVGDVGTTISNVLSEKLNKNPEWRPGFPGEAHLVLPTKHGLTRANYCGPGTNLEARMARGDRGVSEIDTACNKHDILYHLAKSEKDIRDADEALIRDVDATDAGTIQKGILKAGLKAKTLGEDVGLFGPETFTSLPGLEGRGMRGHHAQIACSLANRLGQKSGPFARVCDMHGSGIVSNPQEATDLSHRKALDPGIANIQSNFPGRGIHLSGAGIKEDILNKLDPNFSEAVGKPADKLRKAVFKDIKRAKRKVDLLQSKKSRSRIAGEIQKLLQQNLDPKFLRHKGKGFGPTGSGLKQTGGQLMPLLLAASAAAGPITKLITSSIAAKKRKNQKGKGKFEDFFKFIGQDLIETVNPIVKVFSGKGPRDPTLQNIIGRNPNVGGQSTYHAAGRGLTAGRGLKQDVQKAVRDITKISKRKNPGHTLGKKLLQMHGLTPAKLHKMGISEKHLLPIIKKAIAQRGNLGSKLSGSGLKLAGGSVNKQTGGQFGILASLAASFILPKIISAVKKII